MLVMSAMDILTRVNHLPLAKEFVGFFTNNQIKIRRRRGERKTVASFKLENYNTVLRAENGKKFELVNNDEALEAFLRENLN